MLRDSRPITPTTAAPSGTLPAAGSNLSTAFVALAVAGLGAALTLLARRRTSVS